jgi:hypothetical protein
MAAAVLNSGMIIKVDDETDLTSWFLTAASGGEPKVFSNMLVYRINNSVGVSFSNGRYI